MSEQEKDQEPTEEEIEREALEIKKKAFAEHPEDFSHFKEFVVAVKRTEKGYAFLTNPDQEDRLHGRHELHIAMGELAHRVANYLVRMDMESQLAQKSKIIKPGGPRSSFRNFLGRKK